MAEVGKETEGAGRRYTWKDKTIAVSWPYFVGQNNKENLSNAVKVLIARRFAQGFGASMDVPAGL